MVVDSSHYKCKCKIRYVNKPDCSVEAEEGVISEGEDRNQREVVKHGVLQY